MKPIVIIPAYNPDDKLLTLVEHLRRMDLPVVVVNDGSRSESLSIFKSLKSRFQIEIIDHPCNMGKGATLKTGFRYVFENYAESCGYVTADADSQHAPEDILKVALALKRNPGHFIIGSRNTSAKNVPWKSMMGNRLTSLVFLLSTGKFCSDTQTGLRGVPVLPTRFCFLSLAGSS
jgi:glycosyltransferase involved in cell wall biosynthesis